VLSPGLLLVLSAPSGAGKTTMARMLLESEFPQAASQSATRPGSREARRRKASTTTSSIPSRFGKWSTATSSSNGPRSTATSTAPRAAIVDEAQTSRGIAVFDIDVQGGNAIKRKFPDAMLVFVLPPSMEELERRLRSRGTDSEDVILRRLLASRAEIEKGHRVLRLPHHQRPPRPRLSASSAPS
jgi:guanylate kinase